MYSREQHSQNGERIGFGLDKAFRRSRQADAGGWAARPARLSARACECSRTQTAQHNLFCVEGQNPCQVSSLCAILRADTSYLAQQTV